MTKQDFCIIFLKNGKTANAGDLQDTSYQDVIIELGEMYSGNAYAKRDLVNLQDVDKVILVNYEDGTSGDVTEDAARDYLKEHGDLYNGAWDGEKRDMPEFISRYVDIEDDFEERHARSDYEEHNTMNHAQQL